MEITLIDYTRDAVDKLLYTKATRLTLGEKTRQSISDMSPDQKADELRYMANTIPSSWEFVTYTFEILGVSRAFTHQFVRTRNGSYAQQTMRVLNVEDFSYVTGPTISGHAERDILYKSGMQHINRIYRELIRLGAAVEDARGILPTNICTNIIAQFNLRTLSELAKSRSGGRTQGEYREVVEGMTRCVLEVHPWAKDFLFPEKAQKLKAMEKKLQDLLATGTLTPEQHVDFLKQIDWLKKN